MMKTAQLAQENNDTPLINEFILLSQKTVEYAKLAGSQLRAFSAPQLPHFSRLTFDEKANVLQSLRIYNEICQETIEAGDSLEDSTSFIWHALKKLNFRFPSDLFNHIRKDNIIEIYDCDNVQIFRNFNFFDVTSYTLEDILCRPWVELFVRSNQEHTKNLVESVLKMFTKEITQITSFAHLGLQRIIENDSVFRFEVNAVVEYVSPIYDSNWQPAGIMAIETGSLASPAPIGLEAERLLKLYYNKQSGIEI